jgi:hypothetical protein
LQNIHNLTQLNPPMNWPANFGLNPAAFGRVLFSAPAWDMGHIPLDLSQRIAQPNPIPKEARSD